MGGHACVVVVVAAMVGCGGGGGMLVLRSVAAMLTRELREARRHMLGVFYAAGCRYCPSALCALRESHVCGAMTPRRPRPPTIAVDGDALFAEWSEVAKLRKAPWSWDGASYPKKRSQGPCRESLRMHAPALIPLAKLAPSGYPTQTSVRDVLVRLDAAFGVLECPVASQYAVAGEAADAWRLMLKHVCDLRRGKKQVLPAEIQAILNNLTWAPPHHGDGSDVEATRSVATEVPSPSDLEMDTNEHCDSMSDIDDAVVITREICRCPKCKLLVEEDVSSDENDCPVPSPKIGGQKSETRTHRSVKGANKPHTLRRLTSKTSFQTATPICGLEASGATEPDRLVLPVRMVVRAPKSGRHGEAYLTQATQRNFYVAGVGESRCGEYKQIIQSYSACKC